MRTLGLAFSLALLLLAAPARAQTLYAGDAVQVEWRGRWYAAHVLAVNGPGAWFITYDGFDHSWDETVGPDRIRFVSRAQQPAVPLTPTAGDAVEVEWKGSWYPARILAVRAPGEYFIHYEGYDRSWDETVGPNRIRPAARSSDPSAKGAPQPPASPKPPLPKPPLPAPR